MMIDAARNLEPLFALAAPPDGGNPWLSFIPFILVLGIFYFVILLPMKRRQQKVQTFLAALKVGDRIVTSGGLFGTITRIGDASIQVQVANNVRVEMSRNAVVGYQGQEPVAPESLDGEHGVVQVAEPRGAGGHGVVGMRERAALYGGSLETGPVNGRGFAVRAVLPAESPV